MLDKPPRLCGLCGTVHPTSILCRAQADQQRARKARHDHRRPSARDRGYDSRWDRERIAFLRLNPTCRRCGAPATTVDHIVPHRGDYSAFWNRSNWQPLCARCHNSHKQREDRRYRAEVQL